MKKTAQKRKDKNASCPTPRTENNPMIINIRIGLFHFQIIKNIGFKILKNNYHKGYPEGFFKIYNFFRYKTKISNLSLFADDTSSSDEKVESLQYILARCCSCDRHTSIRVSKEDVQKEHFFHKCYCQPEGVKQFENITFSNRYKVGDGPHIDLEKVASIN